jgi:hypothetical protein
LIAQMQANLSSYALVGIDAVPVDVVVDGNQVKVVGTRSRRVLHSVNQPAPGTGTPLRGSLVQGTPRKRAPAYLNTRPSIASTPIAHRLLNVVFYLYYNDHIRL